MILTEIGEIGVTVGDKSYKLRPSLYSMSKIGEPSEIVEAYASVMFADSLEDALSVIYACSDEDLSDVFGSLGLTESEPSKAMGAPSGPLVEFKQGIAATDDVLTLAKCLLKHGVTGALPPLPRKEDKEEEFTTTFDAREHVSLAMAHLGASSKEAWAMTMTELVGALRAKFPQVDAPGSKAPTIEEHEATMEWYEAVQAAREAKRSVL